jgi:hypothetical protein
MHALHLLVVAASVWAPLAELAGAVTIYSTKAGKTPIATSAAYAAVATLAAYDQTVLNSPTPPSPAVTNNFLVQVSLEFWIARNSSRPFFKVVRWGHVGPVNKVGAHFYIHEGYNTEYFSQTKRKLHGIFYRVVRCSSNS